MDPKEAATKDEFCGVIAIDEKCNGYVSIYKKGDKPGARTELSELDRKNKLTPKTKEKHEHIKKLVSLIKKEGTFMHNGASVTMQELVVAACDDYGDDLEKLAKLFDTKPQFVRLPRDSKDPIADALQSIKKSKTDPGQKYQASTTEPGLAKEDNSVRKESLVNVAKNETERIPRTSERLGKDSTPPSTSSNHSLETPQERKSVGSVDSEDSGTSGRDKMSAKTHNKKISRSITTSKHDEQVTNAGDQMDQTEEMADIIASKVVELLDVKLDKAIKGMMDQMEDTLFSKLGGMLDDKIDKIIKGQDRSSTAKGRVPLPPGHALEYSPSAEPTPCLLYNIQHAPSKVSKIEQQFFDRLEKKMFSEMKQLQQKSTGPSVVFAINSSRIQADIQRDLKSVTFTGPTLLMIIKPMREPDRTPPRLLADDLAGFPVEGKDCHYLLVDNNNTALHDCGVNSDTVDAVARFIAKNQSIKK